MLKVRRLINRESCETLETLESDTRTDPPILSVRLGIFPTRAGRLEVCYYFSRPDSTICCFIMKWEKKRIVCVLGAVTRFIAGFRRNGAPS